MGESASQANLTSCEFNVPCARGTRAGEQLRCCVLGDLPTGITGVSLEPAALGLVVSRHLCLPLCPRTWPSEGPGLQMGVLSPRCSRWFLVEQNQVFKSFEGT